MHIQLPIQCVPEWFLWGYGCQFATLTAHVRPVASGRRLGQLYRLTHDVDLNDIVCRNIDRMPHEKHHMFVVLCVNDTHETCGFVYFFYFEYQLGMKTCFWTSFECCNLKPCGTCNYHSLLNGQTNIYRVSHELRSLLRESVPYVKIYRYNPKHQCPKLNGYGDNGQRSLKLWQLLHTYWLPNTY